MKSICLLLLCGLLACGAVSVRQVKNDFPYHALPHVESDYIEDSEMTDVWAVKFQAEDMDVEEVAEEHGFAVRGQVGSLDKTFVFQEKEERRRGAFPQLSDSKHVEWVEQQVNKKRFTRGGEVDDFPFGDPKFGNQWHVNNEGKDLNVAPLWKKGIRGASCQLAIVDDGLQHSNPDLTDNYNPVGSYDFNYHDSDPDADRSGDTHGTSAAGCAAAVANDICGVGTAPEASLAGIRLISKMASDSEEAAALSYEYNVNQVYSNSWGPSDNGYTMEGPGRLLTASFLDSIQHGRNGKGSIYVWAGGNGKAYKDNGNKDGYNNRPYTISIGAYGYDMKSTYYSEDCACLHAVAPSSGASGPKVVTTYMGNSYGKNCRADFGGTSAAAPMVSGVMCLLLGEYPDLTWRDVQHIIIKSAQPIDVDSHSWATNGAGLNFSHSYGFGKIDADEMLKLADGWESVPEMVYIDSGVETVSDSGRVFAYDVEVVNSVVVEHVSLYFGVSGITRGALTVYVTSPSGMVSQMVARSNDYHMGMEWITTSNAHWGEDSSGVWKVTFADAAGGSTMRVEKYQLVLDGYYA